MIRQYEKKRNTLTVLESKKSNPAIGHTFVRENV